MRYAKTGALVRLLCLFIKVSFIISIWELIKVGMYIIIKYPILNGMAEPERITNTISIWNVILKAKMVKDAAAYWMMGWNP